MKRTNSILILLAMIVGGSAGAASAETITVGPGQRVASLNDVPWRDGLTVRLAPGEHRLREAIHLRANGVTIEPADWRRRPVIRYAAGGWAWAFWLKGSRQTIQGVDFAGDSRTAFVHVYGAADARLFAVQVLPGSAGLANVSRGTSGVTIEKCWAESMERNFLFVGEGELGILDTYRRLNSDIVIRDCYWGASAHEHGVRIHAAERVTIDRCRGNNQSRQMKADVKIHDGRNVLVVDSRFEGRGLHGIGPLADGDGGLYERDPAKRKKKLDLRLRGVTVLRCSFAGSLRVSAGVEGLSIRDTTIAGDVGSAHVNFDGAYGPRAPAAGELMRVTGTNAKKPLVNWRPRTIRVVESGVRRSAEALWRAAHRFRPDLRRYPADWRFAS